MRILQSGPFMSGVNPRRNRPFTPSATIIPVNPADDDTSDLWVWEHFLYRQAGYPILSQSYVVGIDCSESLVGTANSGADVASVVFLYRFAYQAVEDFDLAFAFTAAGDHSTQIVSYDMKVEIIPIGSPDTTLWEDEWFSSNTSFSASGSNTVTFPSSVVPMQARVRLQSYVENDGQYPKSASASLTVSKPA